MGTGHSKGTDRADRSRGHESPRADFRLSYAAHSNDAGSPYACRVTAMPDQNRL